MFTENIRALYMMKYIKLLAILLYMSTLSSAQTLTETIEQIAIIGTKQCGDKLLIISKVDKNNVKISAIRPSGTIAWEQNIAVPTLSGYNFNQWQILANENKTCIVQQTPKVVYFSTLDLSVGLLLESGEIKRKNASSRNNVWILEDNIPQMFSTQDGSLLSHSYDNGKTKTTSISSVASRYPGDKFNVHFGKENKLLLTSRVLEPNHGLMHLYLQQYNTESGDTIQNEIDMELAHTSFTYNSSVDKNVYGVVPSATGFYLIGKLDMAFKKAYPTQKIGDNCIGFWVAKFNDDLTLSYFSEIPFQYLDHIVDADVVQIPSIIDIKEDVSGGLFIDVHELKGVIYHKKYFVYLNKAGEIKMAKGGLDGYHFMEYDRTGLRNAGRKSKLRLMNDDWSYYATNAFLYLNKKEEYSTNANTLIAINENEKKATLAEKAYNFYVVGGKNIYLEYFERGKGTLKIYTD